MFRRMRNSWELFKASVDVLKADKELIIFPIISGICVLIVSASFIVPSIFAGLIDSAVGEEGPGAAHYIVTFCFYLVEYFVIIFFNAAIIGAALIRIRGGDPTVSDGFSIAFSHLKDILGYALISATVGLFLRWLAERGKIGEIVSSLVGLGWNLAIFLAVPILVTEGTGPFEAVKKSSRLLKKTWGEQIVGNFGLGLIFGLVYFLLIIVGVGLVAVSIMSGSVPIIISVGVILVLALISIALIQSALQGIYVAAVYQYAVEGEVGTFFNQELITNAFRRK